MAGRTQTDSCVEPMPNHPAVGARGKWMSIALIMKIDTPWWGILTPACYECKAIGDNFHSSVKRVDQILWRAEFPDRVDGCA